MKFYSKITRKPNAIITEVRDGLKVVERVRLCTFINGELETNDPELIKTLKGRPDMFRTDRHWISNRWEDTEEGKKLLKRGEELGIDTRHVRKEYLIKLIGEAEKKKGTNLKSKVKSKVLQYGELIIKAKTLGINPYGKKKEDLIKLIKEKEKGSD